MENLGVDLAKYKDLVIDWGYENIPKLIIAIFILMAGFRLTTYILKIVDKIFKRQRIDPAASGFLESFISLVLKIVVIVIAATTLGVPMTSFIAILGAAGLAVGLSLQGSLSNFAGGVLVLMFKPFKVGDFIATGSYTGTVDKVTIFNTSLITVDNKVIIIPNGDLSNKEIINYTAKGRRRIDLVVGVSYDSDIEKVRKVLMKVISETPKVLEKPDPDVVITELADSSVNFTLRPWCKSLDYLEVKFELIERVKKEFDKEKIIIPFPQMDVHMKK